MVKKTNATRKLNLYQKEQCILCILVLCFILSIFILPEPKQQTTVSQSVTQSEEKTEPTIPEDTSTSMPEFESETPTNTSQENKQSLPENEDHAPENQVSESTSENFSKNSDSSSDSTPEIITTAPPEVIQKEPEKVWVPPVYETIHHDAVYETVRLYICNYCSEEFKSVGEFQVHKDAHGG